MNGPDPRQDVARERLREIFRRYRETLAGQLDLIDDAVLAALGGTLDDQVRAQAHRAAHQLAGSAGTFGFAEASALARQVELALAPETELAPAELLGLSESAVALRAVLPLDDDAAEPAELELELEESATDDRLVLVVEPQQPLRDHIVALAAQAGFSVADAATPAQAREHLHGVTPAAVVLALSEDDDGDDPAHDLLRQLSVRGVPVIVLPPHDLFADRIALARLGARGYLPRPVTAQQVLEAVHRVLDRVRLDDMRVLAVDDDPVVLAALTELLGAEGLSVVALDDPGQFWSKLEECAPDLLLLDVDMPGVNGLELCRVVRAHARWAQLPVLFLTASTDPQLTREVFEAGADDYLVKPLHGPELVMRISNRLERLRLYRRLAETDPLTGVANRRRAVDQLTRLLLLADRTGTPLSVSLLDVDRFKAVNDEHGHVAGDAVLRELGAHLLAAFRGEDVVARWGGEEFLVAMYGSHREDAAARLRHVLSTFAENSFLSARGFEFGAAFSAGVAEYSIDGDELPQLYRAADSALYAAKARGGRCVVTAAAAGEAPAPAAEVDVVLVEDDEALAPLLLHALDLRGLSTLWLREGEEAAEQLTGAHPAVRAQVAVLDWDLPGLNGAALLRQLASGGTLRRTRVIMLTARSREDEVLSVLELGAADHVAKPFSLPVLLERIRRLLDQERPR